MTKEELIKELEELRDVENYSQSKLLNTGYRTGLLDALDLVKKYFDLADVIKNNVIGSLQLTDEQTKILADIGSQFFYEGVNGELLITEFGILEIFHKYKELISND